jgi:hypothetical protein
MVVSIFTRGGLYPSRWLSRDGCHATVVLFEAVARLFLLGRDLLLGRGLLLGRSLLGSWDGGKWRERCVSGLVQVCGVTDGRCSAAHSHEQEAAGGRSIARVECGSM